MCAREWPHPTLSENQSGGSSVEGRAEQGRATGQREQLGGWQVHPGERGRETARRPASQQHCSRKHGEIWAESKSGGQGLQIKQMANLGLPRPGSAFFPHTGPALPPSSAFWPVPHRCPALPARSHGPSALLHLLLALRLPVSVYSPKFKVCLLLSELQRLQSCK